MAKPKTSSKGGQQTEITLGVLNAVEENSAVTQRSVAGELGIALGLANAYLKRCVRKGLIKVKQIPPNRYAYYLTPKGFTEKSRLSAEYLTSSFTFFRRARSQCAALYDMCRQNGWRRIALWGASDLAEVAVLCNAEFKLDISVVGRADDARDEFAGVLLLHQPADPGSVFDAVIITDLDRAQDAYDRLSAVMPADRILTPALLRVARERKILEEQD